MQLSYVTRPLIESKTFKSILVGNFCLCENLKTKCRNAVSYSYFFRTVLQSCASLFFFILSSFWVKFCVFRVKFDYTFNDRNCKKHDKVFLHSIMLLFKYIYHH